MGVGTPIDGKDVMAPGKRKPLLNTEKDGDRLACNVAEFERVREKARRG